MRKTIITVALILGSMFSYGQTVMIKTIEKAYMTTSGAASKVGIHIMDGDNYEYIKGTKAKDVEGNMRSLYIVFNKYYDKGYKIINTASGGAGGNSVAVVVTTYILKKEQ